MKSADEKQLQEFGDHYADHIVWDGVTFGENGL